MKLSVERLENRLLLAASIKGKNLVVDGTDGVDDIVIMGTGTPGEVEVSFDGGTTFSAPFSGFKNIKVNLFDGDDTLTINSGVGDEINITGNLTIKAGDGDDQVDIAGSYGKNVKIDLGDGDDNMYQGDGNLVVGKNLSVQGGDGDDDIDPHQDITVGGNVKFDAGDGNDRVTNHSGTYTYNGRRVSIKMGAGDDEVDLSDVINVPNAKITLDGGSGADDELITAGGVHTFGNTPKVKNFETITA
jgi:hypothetical protein